MTSLSHTIPTFSGSSLKPVEQSVANLGPINLSVRPTRRRKANISTNANSLKVRAGYSGDGGRQSSTGIFVGGFLLGGIIVGALGWVYAPQISNALAGADKKDLMRKLPKFIYDEEKALEKTRKTLAEKIAQLNSAIDDVSLQLKAKDDDTEVAVNVDEVEAAI
ncbi:Localized to the inner membrane of the chloroplast [Cinnamomum micranthum f. kanehirae]|uniref:Localized to the inner membrane of the chloroplast n=1 Tax=Cinnamomum micranthum f. kanehirae TaxID=337451 RepID=A0A3S3MLB9_9MAGN|nr:Localized to the inner membrane of the chloroplast [Cinnamomum micranthum f. kanehirae]